jgi:hypothetical protein
MAKVYPQGGRFASAVEATLNARMNLKDAT